MTDNYSLCFKVCIGDSMDHWSIQNLQGDCFSRKEYYSSVDCPRLFSEVMRLICKRVLSWWYFACCFTQMACEYLSMEVMERWITSESWALPSLNIKWGFLRRFWGSLCTTHPASGCINTNDTFQWCLVLFRLRCWLEQKSLDVFGKKGCNHCAHSSWLPVVPHQPEYKPGLPGAVENGSTQQLLPHPHQRWVSQHTQSLRGPLWHHERVRNLHNLL